MDSKFIPYGRQDIGEEDIAAVVEALKSDWLTTGPRVGQFEKAFSEFCGAGEGVAVNSGTAALHAAMRALGVGPGDEVIVPAITFVGDANAAVYEGATPVFADIEADTLLIDPASVAARITPKTKAVVAVDYGGQPADYDALKQAVGGRDIKVIADACHSPGGSYKGRKVGTLGDVTAFSFHPVKHLTTCEGGMSVTDNAEYAEHMRRFRNHGIDSDHRKREVTGAFAYDMIELGYNYRLPDVQCALGQAQLKRLPAWIAARQQIAALYDKAFADVPHATPLAARPDRVGVYHLYVVRLELSKLKIDRRGAFAHLRARGIGANVHYAPIYSFRFYRARGYAQDQCPVADRVYQEILTLPMFPAMTGEDVGRVVEAVKELAGLG